MKFTNVHKTIMLSSKRHSGDVRRGKKSKLVSLGTKAMCKRETL